MDGTLDSAVVADDAGVAAIAAACRAAGALALDLEFVAEGRLRPDLGLVQVAWRTGDRVEVAAIDPLAADPGPVLALLAGEVEVIIHAARQDLQLVAARAGVRAARLFDTQVASAFVGLGDQLGYAKLAEEVVGARVDKDAQFSDWLRRPLTRKQLAYALDDVRHLHAAADHLRAALAALGRGAWVEAECAALAEAAWAAAHASPRDAWRSVSGARRLRGADRAALVELASWRWRRAVEENLPPSWVLADRALLELAQARPEDDATLARVRGAGEVARRHGPALRAALAAARDAEPPDDDAGPPSVRATVWSEVFVALVAAAAERVRLPPRWLGARGECEELARLLDRDDPAADAHPLLATWRREVVGADLRAWARGERALVGDRAEAAGVRLAPRGG